MIIFVSVCIKEIVAKGRDFPWPRPDECPRCNGRRIWGHGFVPAFFDGYSCQVFLRRYRCPDCHCVLRLRPLGYFKRFQAPIEKIRSSIAFRLQNRRWPPSLSRARQGHWLRSLGTEKLWLILDRDGKPVFSMALIISVESMRSLYPVAFKPVLAA